MSSDKSSKLTIFSNKRNQNEPPIPIIKEKSMEKCVLERLEKMRDFLSEKANYLKMERIKGISEQFVSNEGNINSVCSLTKFTDK